MPAENTLLLPLANVASPLRKRNREDDAVPQCVRALQQTEMWLAFYVVSNSTSTCGADIARGPLGFYGTPDDCHHARVIHLSWAFAAPGEPPRSTTERYVRIPGVIEEGAALGDVLLQFADALLQMSASRARLVTYGMELNAGILLKEMERCSLPHAQKLLERSVRTRGFDLQDPTVYAWLSGKEPVFPTLGDLAQMMPPGQRGCPEFRTGGDEVALYLHVTGGLRELGMTVCEFVGHAPVRVSRACTMRDNGVFSHDCARCGRTLD